MNVYSSLTKRNSWSGLDGYAYKHVPFAGAETSPQRQFSILGGKCHLARQLLDGRVSRECFAPEGRKDGSHDGVVLHSSWHHALLFRCAEQYLHGQA